MYAFMHAGFPLTARLPLAVSYVQNSKVGCNYTSIIWTLTESLCASMYIHITYVHMHVYVCFYVCIVGRGGALVESMSFDRRVVGSNPALTAT